MLLSTTVFGDGYASTDDTTSRAHLLRSLRPPRRYWLVLATAAIDPPPVSCGIGCWRMIMVIREMIYPLPSPRKMAMTAWLVGVVFDLRLVVPEREVYFYLHSLWDLYVRLAQKCTTNDCFPSVVRGRYYFVSLWNSGDASPSKSPDSFLSMK